jgi:hypothetical protein
MNRLLSLRLYDLSVALGMTPPPEGAGLDVSKGRDGRWWLTGCEEGDCVLPRSRGCHSMEDALQFAEAWLAPELTKADND